jgi:LacI family transcriptional regulator
MANNKESSKEVTIYDIAEALEVATSTVSRGLKNHPSLSVGTIKKVQKQAQKMGYRTNVFAQNLRRQQTNTIGVIVPKLNSHFMSSTLAGMEKVASEKGYNLIISQSFETTEKEASNVETMYKSRVDGLVVSLAYNTKELTHFDPLVEKNIPIIFFDRVADYHLSTNIVIDNFKAGYEATKHLIEHNCERIVHITGNRIRNVYEDRFKGYKKALKEQKISFNSAYVIENKLNSKDGIEAAQQIMKMSPQPDGIFAANDVCAVSCMLALKEHGITIPDDIAVVGFNNDPISHYVEPKLTTINYPGRKMGEITALNLINHLQGDEHIGTTNTVTLNSELIVRKSSVRNNS